LVATRVLEEGRLAGAGRTSRSAKHLEASTEPEEPMKTPIKLAALLVGASIALTGCASGGAKPAAAPSSTADSGTFPVTAGGVTLATKPTHIVSLSPTATDVLFSIGAGSQVVAVDKNSKYFGTPAPATAPLADIDAYKPNAEAISARNPDLVVLSDDTNKIKEQLEALKIPVYLAPAAVTIDDTYAQETALGALTGHVDGAAAVVTAEKKAIADALTGLPERAKPLTYYYELDNTYYSVTSKTFIGSLFTMAHMTNIADASDPDGKAFGYPQLSAEKIIAANPDLIFLADTDCCQQTPAVVAARPGWGTLTAAKDKDKRIIPVQDDIASQWGTRVPQLLQAIVAADKAVPTS
jgi:iron complex transport system substrate-binding protein